MVDMFWFHSVTLNVNVQNNRHIHAQLLSTTKHKPLFPLTEKSIP